MKPVHQTIFTPPQGNCLQAAVASVLELPLDAVPNYMDGPQNHWDVLYAFLARYDLQPLAIPYNDKFSPLGYYIIQGWSPRGDYHHAVVARNGVIAHDPHPDHTGLRGEPFYKIIFVAVQPERIYPLSLYRFFFGSPRDAARATMYQYLSA
jgi:hypothetical protein